MATASPDLHELDDVGRRRHLDALLAELADRPPPRRQHGDAAAVAARAHDVGLPDGADVADVAGASVVAAQQLAVGDDPRADPGRHLHEHHVREVAPVPPVLAERHRVDVALEQRGSAEALGAAASATG